MIPSFDEYMQQMERCTCEWDTRGNGGGYRTPNLQCPVHAAEDAANEALGMILGSAK